MKIPTDQVPQADNINAIEKALKAVANGATTFQKIAEALGYEERQGRYYRRACEILGFIEMVGRNHSLVTISGNNYLKANKNVKKELFGEAIVKSNFFQRTIPFFELNQSGITNEELKQFLTDVTDTTSSMVNRRVNSVLSWLEFADIIRPSNGLFVFNKLPENIHMINYNEPTEPLLPNQFELTVYNTIEDRVNAFTNTITFEINRVKKDRANVTHNRLTNILADKIRERGSIPKSNILVDLAAQINNDKFIFEVKSTTDSNMRSQIRRGISQLYEYRYLQNIPRC